MLDTNFTDKEHSLAGYLLVATPLIQDGFFDKSVIYLCSHTAEGAMGLILNQPIRELQFGEVLEQLDIKLRDSGREMPIHFGGPVEPSRGFILHTTDYQVEHSFATHGEVVATANIALLRDVANGFGPRQGALYLGYAGWAPGQLESEMEQGSWLTVPATAKLIFDTENDMKWHSATTPLGVDMSRISTVVGHA